MILGFLSGILIFTPFEDWRYADKIHHATAGDPDRRGIDDIWTMTVEEYLATPLRKRLAYRIHRNPFILFIAGPVLLFLFFQQFPTKGARKRERNCVALDAVCSADSFQVMTMVMLAVPASAKSCSLTLGLVPVIKEILPA